MAVLRVTIVDPMGDKTFDVELPADAPMRQLVPQLLPKLGISQQGTFTLQDKETMKIFGPDETLSSAGVQAGRTLRIVQSPQAATAL